MALEHKGFDIDNVEVDPYDKFEWWLDVSRGSAMVPVIAQSDESAEESTVLDSNRILEYPDDVYPQKKPDLLR